MAKVDGNMLNIVGRLKKAGLSFYERGGKVIVRSAQSHQPRRMSRKQFALRQRMTHNNALWRALDKKKKTFFEGGSSPCHRFRSINTDCPAVYLTKYMRLNNCSLLLPNMVLSDGPLQPINYQLGDVDGQPALLTDMTPRDAKKGELLLYVLEQRVYPQQVGPELFQLGIYVETLTPADFVTVPSTLLTPYKSPSGTLALLGERFADPMQGFGIVRVKEGHASPQRAVTNCTYYKQYTTEEALQAAAQSYGGLTEKDEFLRPKIK